MPLFRWWKELASNANLCLLIYFMCRPKWSDDIEICAKFRDWKQKAQGVVVSLHLQPTKPSLHNCLSNILMKTWI